MSRSNVDAIQRIMAQVDRFIDPDVMPLMTIWRQIIETDNANGIMQSLDGFGQPMPRVTYRPKGEPKETTHVQRNGAGRVMGVTAGRGPHAAGLHNNLTHAEYEKLGGPPLAPRGMSSRVITNLETGQGFDPSRRVYYAVGFWREVVSSEGVEFLDAHFTGATCGRGHKVTLPVRDLRGIRPWGQEQCLAELEDWGFGHLKATFI